MAADVGKVYPIDVSLLRKEIEVQGDLISQERLERRTEIDRLRLELDTLKRLFERMQPGFLAQFNEIYARERETWNPDFEKPERKVEK